MLYVINRHIDKNSTSGQIHTKAGLIYSQDEICPVCGAYNPDGNVCVNCQKEYDLYESNTVISEEVIL